MAFNFQFRDFPLKNLNSENYVYIILTQFQAQRQTQDLTEQQALLERQQQELRATIQSMENLLAESRGQASSQAAKAAELEQDNRTVSLLTMQSPS